MADILIKNMEMPKEGSITIKIRHDGAINFIGDMGSNLGRLVDCKAVALPSHGRLIDADVLQKELAEHGHPSEREWYFAEVGQFIDEAETIVEASN